jgi:hypothetical protein
MLQQDNYNNHKLLFMNKKWYPGATCRMVILLSFVITSYKNQVILYGSQAKGTFKNGSDIDLTIIDSGLTTSYYTL